MSNYNSNLSNKSYFRSIIPKDLRNTFGGRDEFRLSLRYVINGDTKILCLKLKEITDKLFTEIREGMKNLSMVLQIVSCTRCFFVLIFSLVERVIAAI